MATIIRKPRFIIVQNTNNNNPKQPWTVPTDSTAQRNNFLNNYWGRGGDRLLVLKTSKEIKNLLSQSVNSGMIMLKVEHVDDPSKVTIEWLPCDLQAAQNDPSNCNYYVIEDMFLTERNIDTIPGGIIRDESHDAFAATIGKGNNGDHCLIINAIKFENVNMGGFGGEPEGVGTKIPDTVI